MWNIFRYILALYFCMGLTFCSKASDSSPQNASAYNIKGKLTNISSYSDVTIQVSSTSSLSISNILNSLTTSSASPDSSGDFSVEIGEGCYNLAIAKPAYRDRNILHICADTNHRTIDLGDVGLSVERRFVMAASVGNEVIMAGGANADGNWTTVDILNVATGTLRIDNLIRRRARGIGAAVNNKALFAGGEECVSAPNVCTVSSLVEIYDSTTGSWTSTDLSVARAELSSAVTSDGYVVFAGGWTNTTVSDAVDIYNSNTGAWTTTT